MALAFESRLLIDGTLTEAAGGATYDNINPATEEVIGPVADVAGRHGARSTARAHSTRPRGRPTGPSARRILEQLTTHSGKHREELRGQIVAEVGTPIGLTYAVQQDSCIDDMQYDIDLIDSYMWEERLGTHEFFGMQSDRLVVREPIGVAGLITPWNFPFMLNLSKLAPRSAADAQWC